MSELKLFTTPAEEMELSSLRSRVMALYALAFKRIDVELSRTQLTKDLAMTVLEICRQTIEEADRLAAAHKEKWKDK